MLRPHPHLMQELALRAAGFRATPTRLRLVEIVRQNPRRTAGELSSILRKEGIGKANLYRSLDVLEQAGLIMRMLVKGDVLIVPARHYGRRETMACNSCGLVLPIAHHELNRVIRTLGSKTKWRQISYSLQIRGVCRTCQLGIHPVGTRL